MDTITYEYVIQDPDMWVEFATNLALSLLGLFVYVVFKVYKIAAVLGVRQFLNRNMPFFIWHALATLALGLVAFLAPESLLATLGELGVHIDAKYSFLTIGLSLASMAYGHKKKEMLEQIKLAKRAKEELEYLKE